MLDDAEEYARSFEVFSSAHGLLGEALNSYLHDACGGDESLRKRVLELLAASADDPNGAGDAFADSNLMAARQTFDAVVTKATTPWLPDKIGDYQILREIGRGGMGVVYEAQQSSPNRRVALKLLSPMQTTADAVKRFQRETELLGRLQHQGIAQIFEASTFDAGQGSQPYFAMELVEGRPITDYANEEDLDTRARLALLAELCDVIQYAHDRGVIHRDLKPANILVATSNTTVENVQSRNLSPSARIKILDFGIARIADPNLATNTLQTSTGQIVGTISYMSPEQASGDPKAIDPRTDVYTLGVLAYELLSQSLPHSSKGMMLHDAVRAIREDDPTDLGTIDSTLRGDVETIVAKALEKERVRRYDSAAEMAADIRRHLSDLPIHARPQSSLYQLRKFARRNRTLVGGVAATLIVAIVGATVAMGYAIDSQKRANELERVAQFYSSQWSSIDLGVMAERLKESTVKGISREQVRSGTGPELNADRQELERLLKQTDFALVAMQFLDETVFNTARTTLNQQFEDLPQVRAQLLETLSQTMHRLGLVRQAAPLQETALELHRKEFGDAHRSTLRSLSLLGNIRLGQGKGLEAAQLLRPALEGQRRLLPANSPEIRSTLTWLGMCVETQEEGLAIKRELLGLSMERLGPEDPHTLHLQADILLMEGKRGLSADQRLKSLIAYRKKFGEHNLSTLIATGNLAVEFHSLGRIEEAEALARKALAGSREQLGEQHPQTTNFMSILGQLLCVRGQLDEAEIHLRKSLALRLEHHGPNDKTTQDSRRQLDLLLEARAR
jgi:serine/threonine protein kinase